MKNAPSTLCFISFTGRDTKCWCRTCPTFTARSTFSIVLFRLCRFNWEALPEVVQNLEEFRRLDVGVCFFLVHYALQQCAALLFRPPHHRTVHGGRGEDTVQGGSSNIEVQEEDHKKAEGHGGNHQRAQECSGIQPNHNQQVLRGNVRNQLVSERTVSLRRAVHCSWETVSSVWCILLCMRFYLLFQSRKADSLVEFYFLVMHGSSFVEDPVADFWEFSSRCHFQPWTLAQLEFVVEVVSRCHVYFVPQYFGDAALIHKSRIGTC